MVFSASYPNAITDKGDATFYIRRQLMWLAVGAVVMNRIKSASFPNTMAGVIYQSYAFTAVNDGQINLTPDATAKKAAQDAMNGWDPTYGAIYYYNPAIATSSWIFSRKTTVTIGNHVFAK